MYCQWSSCYRLAYDPWGWPTDPSGLIGGFRPMMNLFPKTHGKCSWERLPRLCQNTWIYIWMHIHVHMHQHTWAYVLLSHMQPSQHKHGYKDALAHTQKINLITLAVVGDGKIETHQSMLLNCWKRLTGQAKASWTPTWNQYIIKKKSSSAQYTVLSRQGTLPSWPRDAQESK